MSPRIPVPKPRVVPPSTVTAEALRLWREKRDLSKAELATILGVTRQAVDLWERGKAPTPAMLHLALESAGERQWASDILATWGARRNAVATVDEELELLWSFVEAVALTTGTYRTIARTLLGKDPR